MNTLLDYILNFEKKPDYCHDWYDLWWDDQDAVCHALDRIKKDSAPIFSVALDTESSLGYVCAGDKRSDFRY